MFAEYGAEENLQEILERLSLYCTLAGCDNPQISVILPKKAQDYYNREFQAKERVEHVGKPGNFRQLWCSGVVTLFNSDEHEVRPLSLWAKIKRGIPYVRYGSR